jgi:hypothetical protein
MLQLATFLLSAVLFQAAPAPPVATTGAADAITRSSAAVTGTVNPGGAATTYRFEYGTSSSYGLTTAEQDAGSGADPVAVRATLSNLTTDTTYHYRVVATNAAGLAQGADRTLRTSAAPSAPSISSRAATGVGADGATLSASVNPRSLATSVRFEYGTTTSYGSATAEQAIGAGGSSVAVNAPIGGLKPNTRYQFRAVATSAAGVTRGANRSFTTAKVPTGVAVTPSTIRPVWGTGLTLRGTVSGAGSTPVALEKQDFPYTGAFGQIATATASSSGAFTLTAPALFVTTRLRVVTNTAVVAVSPVTTVSVAVKVGLKTKRLKGKRVQLEGATWPAVPSGRVSLQRQSSSGRWGPVDHATPVPLAGGRSRYRFTVPRRTRALNYRVVVLARDGGAHVPGTSRIVTLPKR